MPELGEPELKFLLQKYTPQYLAEEYLKNFVLVFEEDEKILGVGSLLMENAEIRGLYIDPAAQNKGIGSQLLTRLEQEAKNRGLKKVITNAYFQPEKFYANRGYEYVQKGSHKKCDATFNYVVMEKSLE